MLTRQTRLEPLVDQLESEIANATRIRPVRRKAVRLLRMCGYTNRQVGIILGISDSHVGCLAQRRVAP